MVEAGCSPSELDVLYRTIFRTIIHRQYRTISNTILVRYLGLSFIARYQDIARYLFHPDNIGKPWLRYLYPLAAASLIKIVGTTLAPEKKSRDHVIVSSGWWSCQAGRVEGGGSGTRDELSALHSALGASTLRWINSLIHCSPPTAIVKGEHLFADHSQRIHRGRKGDVGSTSDCAGSVEPDHAEDSSRIARAGNLASFVGRCSGCDLCSPLTLKPAH